MDATATAREPNELLDFDQPPISYATHPASYGLEGGPHSQVLDDHDFDSFIEEQLRDGTGSLYPDAMNWMERRLLVRVLAQTNGNKSRACQILGITRGSLRHKICQLGISIHQTVSVNDADGH